MNFIERKIDMKISYSDMTLEEVDKLSKAYVIVCDGDSQSLVIKGSDND